MSFKILNILLSFSFINAPIRGVNHKQIPAEGEIRERRVIHLTGSSLSIEDVVAIARSNAKVEIESSIWEKVARSHDLLLAAAKEDKPIYGLNRGVGLNKDKKIFKGDALSDEALAVSVLFNRSNLHATSSAVGPEMPNKMVRAIMLVKLNSILQGTTGAQPKVAELLAEFLKRDIHPIVPSRGSVGEADIMILSHIGLALMGEGEVFFQGKRTAAKKALELNHLAPLVPYAKDSLAIMSSNAYSAALGALLLHDAEQLLNRSDAVFAVSLEGLNGNIAPLLEEVQNLRPYPGQMESAARIRKLLEGSSLWIPSRERELQDPLSFRSVSQVHGTARDFLNSAKQKLLLHLNSSDDNPVTVLDPKAKGDSEQESAFYLSNGKGAVIPTSNFDSINWAIDFEALGIALSHLSHLSSQRMVRLATDRFTHLSRFLSPNATPLAFSAIQKTFMALDAENRSLSMPVSADFFPIAGDIEDHATNAPAVLARTCQMIDNLYYILGMELMHASQAVDLRTQAHPHFQLGSGTRELYEAYRKEVPFLDKDRPLSKDIEISHDFLVLRDRRTATPTCIFKDP